MPVLAAVAIAAGATGMAVAAGAALATAVTYVGIGMTVVGAVTGNQNFAKVGAIMGLAGGIGSAIGAMSETATAATAEEMAAALPDVADPMMTGVSVPEAASSGVTTAGIDVPNAASTSAPAEQAAASIDQTAGAAQPPAGGMDKPPGMLSQTQATPTVPAAQAQQEMPVTGSPAPTEPAPNINVTNGDPLATGISPPTDTTSSGIKAWWSRVPVTQQNEYIKAAASGVGQLFNGWSAEQRLAFEREQANLKQANIDRTQGNLNAQPTVAFKPVNGHPARQGLLSATKG